MNGKMKKRQRARESQKGHHVSLFATSPGNWAGTVHVTGTAHIHMVAVGFARARMFSEVKMSLGFTFFLMASLVSGTLVRRRACLASPLRWRILQDRQNSSETGHLHLLQRRIAEEQFSCDLFNHITDLCRSALQVLLDTLLCLDVVRLLFMRNSGRDRARLNSDPVVLFTLMLLRMCFLSDIVCLA